MDKEIMIQAPKSVLYTESALWNNAVIWRYKISTVAMSCVPDPAVNRVTVIDTVNAIMHENPNVELVAFDEMMRECMMPDSSLPTGSVMKMVPTGMGIFSFLTCLGF
jgi:hypothetical protein